MRYQLVLTVTAFAVVLSGCSSRPRNFAPVLSAAPTDSQAYEAQWMTCRNLVAAGKYNSSGVGASAATGLAAGAAATTAVGAALPATYATYGGAFAAAGATIIAAPIGLLVGAYGVSKVKKAKKEKAVKALTADCMAKAGYQVADWRVLSKRESRQLDATAKAKAEAAALAPAIPETEPTPATPKP